MFTNSTKRAGKVVSIIAVALVAALACFAASTFAAGRAEGLQGSQVQVQAVDKTALQNALDAASAASENTRVSEDGSDVSADKYWVPANSLRGLGLAITDATTVLNGESATQEQIDAATETLLGAIESFNAAKQPGAAVDKSKLKEAIDAAYAATENTRGSYDGTDVPTTMYWVPIETTARQYALIISTYEPYLIFEGYTQEQIDAATEQVLGAIEGYNAAKQPGSLAVVEVHRMYNPNSGEHLFTGDAHERDALGSIGWNYEGVCWYSPETSPAPVFRLYNPNAPGGDHHYTTSAVERDHLTGAGWIDDGAKFYSTETELYPVYSVYNPNAYDSGKSGAHHFTQSYDEGLYLQSLGWVLEDGVKWYAAAPAPAA